MNVRLKLAVLSLAAAACMHANAQAVGTPVKCKMSMLTDIRGTKVGSRTEYTYTVHNMGKQNLTMYVFIQKFPTGFTVDRPQRSGVVVKAGGGTFTDKLGSSDSATPPHVDFLYDVTTSSNPYISLMNCQVAP